MGGLVDMGIAELSLFFSSWPIMLWMGVLCVFYKSVCV